MSRVFIKFIFYPIVILLSLGIVIGEFISLFIIPELSPVISRFLLVLGIGAIGRLFWKTIRLGVAEIRQKARGELQILPPRHYQKRSEIVIKQPNKHRLRVVFTVVGVILAIAASFAAGLYVKDNVLFFQAPQKSSCIAAQPPMPLVPNDVPNSSMEEENSSNQPAGWQTEVTGHNVAQFLYTSSGHQGHALSVTIKNYSNGSAMWFYTPQPAVSGQMYHYSDWYQSDTSTSLYLMFILKGTTNYQVIDKNIPASAHWMHYSKSFDIPDRGDSISVSVIHALSSSGSLTITDVIFHPEMRGFVRPLISFAFDDGWMTQYTNGLPLLCKYKVPATFYIISGYLSYADYMHPPQINTLIQDGEEIGSHTVDHTSLVRLFPNQVTWELTTSQQTLQQQFGQNVTDFASPYGAVNDRVIQQIRQVYQSHRGTNVALNDPADFNPYNIQSVIYDNSMKFGDIKNWIDQAIQTKNWLVLTFHQVDNSGGEYSVTPELLEQILAYVASHSVIRPMTVNQALMEVYQQT